ncbi:MAG TPA: glycosyltransferase [Acetobacteraceae bacterium]
MILVIEPTWTGTLHAPGNSATIQTISDAFPDQQIRVFADPSHLRELQNDTALTRVSGEMGGVRGLSFHPITLGQIYLHRPHIVSVRRLASEVRILRTALRTAPPHEPCLILLISATSTAIFAAAMLLRLSRRPIGVQVGLHGDLNSMFGWRSRNPLIRAMDLPSMMRARGHRRLRFLVLEDAIRQELARLAPEAAKRTDVLPLPINVAELPLVPEPRLARPLRIGFVGQATEAKGISTFLDIARDFKARCGDAIEFHLIGRIPPGAELNRFAVLDSPASAEHLPRQDFLDRLARIHFAFLPFQPGYYNLSASGALLDAMTWTRPIIATRLPIVADLFARHGDIGYICNDVDGMRGALQQVLSGMDQDHYQRQVSALREARESRMPAALAKRYQAIIRDGFDNLLAPR